MAKDTLLHELMTMPDPCFAVKLTSYSSQKTGTVIFDNHWHEQIEILYFKSGSAIIECNYNPIYVKAGDLVIINSNDLHQGTNISNDLYYYCIILDTSFLYSKSVDTCDTKYITPITRNFIIFNNKIENDDKVKACIKTFIQEYLERETGYELALKSCIYQLFTDLLRNHSAYTISLAQYKKKMENRDMLEPIFQYIENHYNEALTISLLCKKANISKYYFCHLFKVFTGMTFTEYLNYIRTNKAEHFLKNTDMTVTEIASYCGYNNLNYFSRIYKKHKFISPSMARKES